MNIDYFKKLSPSRKLILGFLFAILLGTFILMMPFSLKEGEKLSFLSSLFTIVSAVCVTGLTVVDVSKVFSPAGDLVIIFFIQLGGLGVMTFSSILFLAMGKRMTFYERELLKEERNADSSGEISSFIKKLLLTVFIIESIGAIILTWEFAKEMPINKAVFYGIFHSISAFCNAGFSLFSNNLEAYKANPIINLTIGYLITLGGIGFAVITSVIMVIRRGIDRFNLTSKVAIIISMILTFGGMILFFILEYSNSATLGDLNFIQKILASYFQSVTLRTAGFNTIPLGELRNSTIFMCCILMFIGASPGSTGGGIKTTTFGVILFYVIGIVKKKENVEIFNRRLDWEIMNRALAILVLAITYVSIVIMLMLIAENFSPEEIVFEVISAFGTVGLTLGITPDLSTFSKLLLIFTMFVGRLGPMTFALAIGETKKKALSKYPKENILVG
ncbi:MULTISPECIES: TrkH family potassium uptake protein [Fusobacterium]|jgi:trk system potassium uptake protein TrkH|uniref:Potassium transporter KtrB n=1 Tax=Fusobacterium varium ATCC 27725 TaxID=469618 RepID=A0ABN5JD45_FUSVA|nr:MULTISPECIES: TrkH family potassium uptake protein [Fusobacterium]AVQ29693.1 potassium transporter KtrB [Fusobacterium varium ATCC 27725]EES64471.2 putative ATP synthase F0, A subunit [Fusobacterium varium ATCC 27725]MCF0169938.1 potassium transporter KtrB [Fusobacterium varium]RHG34952.1 potassium transporter KtrB [Fusobacterium varium]UYI78069.1 MAG: TrkH family potassium uptake protein [Fusobacterium varium]